jgi:hypothetical protein
VNTLAWHSGDLALRPYIDAAIRGWIGTKYMSGQQVRGAHADCVRFACGVLDDLYGRRRILPRNLAIDAAIHAPEEAWAQLRRLLEVYPEAEALHPDEDGIWNVEPGDVVVTGLKNGGPGHLVIVGARASTCWEAPRPACAVREIGIGLHPTQHVKHAFRMSDRESWVR